jgi:hypothetical protein
VQLKKQLVSFIEFFNCHIKKEKKIIMAEFVAGKGTTALGIIGTVLGSLGVAGNNGMGLNLLGNNSNCSGCSEDHLVNRYEAAQQAKIADLETQVALRDSNTYTDQKLLELYKYFDGEVKDIRATTCANDKAQAVVNANLNASIVALNGQVAATAATLAGITRTAVPRSSICDFCNSCCSNG